ncbi:MAG: dipeptide ABC transporter ATP-binding protein [Candidatus Binatia bacterium]
MALLEVDNLRTYLYTRRGVNRAVDGVSFELDRGRSLGLVGESGSGKSMTALSILRLAPKPAAKTIGGNIRFEGEDLLTKSEKEMRHIRGGGIAIILQDPLTSLNPVFSVQYQVGESVKLHQHLSGRAQLDRVIDSLRRVHVPAPEIRMKDYPHQFSGGMRQRVVGATAIACEPKLLIADEATTALDATIQAQYLMLLRGLQKDLNLALLFITHDFGIVAKMCDDVAVMYAGRIVEYADVRETFNHPAHPYTLALLQAVPKVDGRVERLYAIPGSPATGWTHSRGCPFASRCAFAIDRCSEEKPPLITLRDGHTSECWRAEEVYAKNMGLSPNGNPDAGAPDTTPKPITNDLVAAPTNGSGQHSNKILEVEDLRVFFPVKRGLLFKRETLLIKAVDGISFEIKEGETFSIVGESGCGKTTTARAILKVEAPTEGRVLWHGKDIQELNQEEMRAHRSAVQAVFQDPYSSMNPRMRVGDFITEPLLINTNMSKSQRRERAEKALQQVGLRAEDINNFPHEFSGGQRQRIAIARALSSSPRVIVLDEPVSSLDVSIRAQIMNLLKDLQEREGFSYLFIAHHLGTVRYMSQMVGVMYLGRLMEMSECEELFKNPLHPYTRALFSAALPDHPGIEREELLLQGDVAAATAVPSGCRLHPRCPMAMQVCAEVEPAWKEVAPRHWTACHLY